MDNKALDEKLSLVEFKTLNVGVPTQNNRIYPKEVIEKALKEYQKQISERRAFVTMFSEGCVVNLKDVVGLVQEAKIKDDNLTIKMEILDTPASLVLKSKDGTLNASLIKVAPFGIATLKDNVVQDDYELIGFHIDLNYERRNED